LENAPRFPNSHLFLAGAARDSEKKPLRPSRI
jgi:hypothetical protein